MLSRQTKLRLIAALTRRNLADEFEAKINSPAPLSARLKAAILAMMGNKKAADEVIFALETPGNQVLSGPEHPNAKRRFELALASKKAAEEIDSQI